jgi:hypothetical protein
MMDTCFVISNNVIQKDVISHMIPAQKDITDVLFEAFMVTKCNKTLLGCQPCQVVKSW